MKNKVNFSIIFVSCLLGTASYASDISGEYSGKANSGFFRKCSVKVWSQDGYQSLEITRRNTYLKATVQQGEISESHQPGIPGGKVLQGVQENGYGFETVAIYYLNPDNSLGAVKITDQGNAFFPRRQEIFCADLKKVTAQ